MPLRVVLGAYAQRILSRIVGREVCDDEINKELASPRTIVFGDRRRGASRYMIYLDSGEDRYQVLLYVVERRGENLVVQAYDRTTTTKIKVTQ